MLPTHARLHALFGSILLTACGGATDGTELNRISLCADDRPPRFPVGLVTTPQQDYVAAKSESAFLYPESETDRFSTSTSVTSGVPCASAKDASACEAKLAAYRVLPLTRAECEDKYPNVIAPGGRQPGCRVSYLVLTRGDEVTAAIGDENIHNLVGNVDTVQEAEWILERSYTPSCGGSRTQDFTVRAVDHGFEFTFANNCERTALVRTVFVGPDESVVERSTKRAAPGVAFSCVVAGRRHGCSVQYPSTDYFASMANLELSAAQAFRSLAKDLRAHCAPKALITRTYQAARDELRHTRAALSLTPHPHPRSHSHAHPHATLHALALENAREGTARELYGALLAHHQAKHAKNPRVRAVMRAIAPEETAHAALSLDLEAWILPQLSSAERAAVEAERTRAFSDLRQQVDVDPPEELRRGAGLPTRGRALVMLDSLSLARVDRLAS